MALTYSARIRDVAVSVAQDIWTITAPSDAVIELVSCVLGQSSDLGEAQEEALALEWTGYAGAGSGGTTPTARPHESGFPASGAAIAANNTTQGTTPTELQTDVWYIRGPFQYFPVPDERLWISPSGVLALELPSAPADVITLSGKITWKEYGG